MVEVVGELTEAIRNMRVDRVPPPASFTGGTGIDTFLVAFEKYALAVYKNDTNSWLQVLPAFMEGEARAIVNAFGMEADYAIVKQRLIEEFTKRTTLSSNEFADFFSASRHIGESLVCFSIRLETMARKVSSASTTSMDMMVRSKFLSAISPSILQQMNVQLGHQEDATLSQLVKLATILESQQPSWGPKAVPLSVTAVADISPIGGRSASQELHVCKWCNKVGHLEVDCFQKQLICFRCNAPGHFARNCPENSQGTSRENRGRGRGMTSSYSGSGEQTGKCSFCGKGRHVLAECDLFKRRCLACVWCGALDHESYRCSQKPSSSGNVHQPGK